MPADRSPSVSFHNDTLRANRGQAGPFSPTVQEVLRAQHHHADLLAELLGDLEHGAMAWNDVVRHTQDVDATLLLLLRLLAGCLPQLGVIQILKALKQVTCKGGRDMKCCELPCWHALYLPDVLRPNFLCKSKTPTFLP